MDKTYIFHKLDKHLLIVVIYEMNSECVYKRNATFAVDGYDATVYGRGHSCFYILHGTSIFCLCTSLMCAILVMVALFKSKKKSFMKWQKHERFLIYRCICNSIYAVTQIVVHIQVITTQDHIRPKGLCILYAIILVNMCSCESSFSLISALNAFVSVTFRKNVEFGSRDWKLLVQVFIIGPASLDLLVLLLDVLGPTGFFCGFDIIKGVIAYTIMSTGAISLVLISLTVLYILTWRRIYKESQKTKSSNSDGTGSATVKSAKAMCLLVAVYIVQWFPMCIFGTWQMIGDIPFGMFMSVILSTNIGGVLSGIVYLLNAKSKNSVSNVDLAVDIRTPKPNIPKYPKKLPPLKRGKVKKEISSKTISAPTTEKF